MFEIIGKFIVYCLIALILSYLFYHLYSKRKGYQDDDNIIASLISTLVVAIAIIVILTTDYINLI